jgi:hypothetical protein
MTKFCQKKTLYDEIKSKINRHTIPSQGVG